MPNASFISRPASKGFGRGGGFLAHSSLQRWKYIVHFFLQADEIEPGLLFLSSPVEGRLGPARKGPVSHPPAGHFARLSAITKNA